MQTPRSHVFWAIFDPYIFDPIYLISLKTFTCAFTTLCHQRFQLNLGSFKPKVLWQCIKQLQIIRIRTSNKYKLIIKNIFFTASANAVGEEYSKESIVSLTEYGGRSIRNNIYTQRNGVSSIPRSLRTLLEVAFDNPSIWWIGQAFSFLTQPNQHFETLLDDIKRNIGFKSPIAG